MNKHFFWTTSENIAEDPATSENFGQFNCTNSFNSSQFDDKPFHEMWEMNAQSMDILLSQYHYFILKLAKKFIRIYSPVLAREDAYDLAQEVMLRFPQILKNFKAITYNRTFESYLAGCLNHLGVDMIRKRLGRKGSKEIEEETKNISGNSDISSMLTIKKALSILPDQALNIIRQYYFEGYTDIEIASQLKASKYQIWRIRQAALKKLKAFI